MHKGPIRCPNCNSQARTHKGARTTLLHYDKQYDAQGKEISKDPNTTTTTWQCTDCGNEYNSYTQYGETYQIT